MRKSGEVERKRPLMRCKYKCQQCGLIVELACEEVRANYAPMCPECAKEGATHALVPMCGLECAAGGPCGCAVPGFACS